MKALALVERARRFGVTMKPEGDALRLSAPHQPPADLIAELRQHKAEIMALLTGQPPETRPEEPSANRNQRRAPAWTADDWFHFYGERAGISESDGGEERARAEFLAFEQCISRYQEFHPGTGRREAARALIGLGLPPHEGDRQ